MMNTDDFTTKKEEIEVDVYDYDYGPDASPAELCSLSDAITAIENSLKVAGASQLIIQPCGFASLMIRPVPPTH